ncbi:DUF6792 domain-containing protein [Neoroseomonas oryzicola]|uniref:DUF2974 domain-containing protein n=1 Tax=Neoroseomonas oryzicola TaxID=535904 RepID=A0A9X9WEK7_9PROT|nr:DUF6792 domain-containing protein [Neoroseomonas oryzicola]MBR0658767.1 DUF2974 domain-containing protein [Neoroseomonas oryzicola]NKE17245.1 DUF2974 domain-containing protein [Neoroseomonas oryzicola]
MSITILDCAEAASAVYKNLDFENWVLVRGIYDPKNTAVRQEGYSIGFYSRLGIPNLYIISARGSAKGLTTKDWMDDDLSIGVGRTPDRYAAALAFTQATMQRHPGTYMVVGHSLGGHIAQMVGVMCNLHFVTFNAPPAIGTWSGTLPNGVNPAQFKKGLNYRVNYDPVSLTSGTHVGPLVTLRLYGKSIPSAHTKKTYINSVKMEGIGGLDAFAAIAGRNGQAFRL